MPGHRARKDPHEDTTPHPRTDHQEASRGRPSPGRRQDHRRGGQAPRDLRAELPPLAKSVRRHESQRRQGAQSPSQGEPATQADRRRSAAREPRPQGDIPGKLLSPARKRVAVNHLINRLDISERRARRITGQSRSTQRRLPIMADRELELRSWLVAFAKKRPRYGYRRAHAIAKKTGFMVNRKRVQRIWREEGLKSAPQSHKEEPNRLL